jgi:hypothetical protein
LDTGEKRYFSSDHFSSFIYEPDAVLKFVEDLIKRHKERGDYESISSKTADDLVKELNIDSFSKSIDVDGTTWDIDANVTSAGKTVCVTVTCTPSGKGNIKYGNRMELYFLPISDDQFKRHLGAFDRPNSANGWMSSKLKTVSKKEMEAEIHKVFETVKSKDETGYNKYFQK